jgi:hypothetical protein
MFQRTILGPEIVIAVRRNWKRGKLSPPFHPGHNLLKGIPMIADRPHIFSGDQHSTVKLATDDLQATSGIGLDLRQASRSPGRLKLPGWDLASPL